MRGEGRMQIIPGVEGGGTTHGVEVGERGNAISMPR